MVSRVESAGLGCETETETEALPPEAEARPRRGVNTVGLAGLNDIWGRNVRGRNGKGRIS